MSPLPTDADADGVFGDVAAVPATRASVDLGDVGGRKARSLIIAQQHQLTRAAEQLQPEDICETLTMITLRKAESIFSEVITELPAGLDIKVVAIGSTTPRRRAKVVAGSMEGWITVLTSFNEPLIRIKRTTEVDAIRPVDVGRRYRLKCMTQVRDGEALDSRLVCELVPGAVVRILAVSGDNRRRGRVSHESIQGWISFATSLGQLRVEGPLPREPEDGIFEVLERSNATADELRAVARDASDKGVDLEQVRKAERAAASLEARARLRAVCVEGPAAAGAAEIRAALTAAVGLEVPAEEIAAAERRLLAEERKQEALGEVEAVVEETSSVDRSSIDSIRAGKARLVEVIRRAREIGVQEVYLKAADTERKKMHNLEEDMKGAIRVFCRIRPLIARERSLGDTQVVTAVDSTTVGVQLGRHSDTFNFDAVFAPGSQEEVFEDCRHLMQSVLDGYNVTLFAYGQTGAGKTFTMYGTPGEEGTAPRTIQELFDCVERDSERYDHAVSASMMELYRNELVDLINPRALAACSTNSTPRRRCSAAFSSPVASGGFSPATPLRRESAIGFGHLADMPTLPRLSVKTDVRSGEVQIDNITEERCATAADLLRLLETGAQQRRVAATALNSESSRSHLILTVRVVRTNKATGERVQGKIMMCDLAGSERLKKSEVTGDAQKEAIEINKALTAIGDVIEALTSKQKHVPYKNHKLTQVLQDALGGTSKTLMFVNCSPASSNLEETVNALKYAMRVKKVTNPIKRCSSARPPAAA